MENKPLVPLAIIVAGILIAGAIIFTNGNGSGQQAATGNIPTSGTGDIEMRPVGASDHIRGSANAHIVIVEYSDTECPYCKQFHTTMRRIIDEYGKDGQVAWVYRHFPIDGLHAKARHESEATECAAELGGEEGFWNFTDRLYELTPSNDGLDPALLPDIAVEVGIDKTAFESCLSSGRHAAKVQADYDDAVKAGGNGTPHNIVITKDGQKAALPGALPYDVMEQVIDSILSEA